MLTGTGTRSSPYEYRRQAAFSSAYLDWDIQQGLFLRQAANAETIDIFQLLRGCISSLFYTTHVGLCQVIMRQYTSWAVDAKDLLSGALSLIHTSCEL